MRCLDCYLRPFCSHAALELPHQASSCETRLGIRSPHTWTVRTKSCTRRGLIKAKLSFVLAGLLPLTMQGGICGPHCMPWPLPPTWTLPKVEHSMLVLCRRKAVAAPTLLRSYRPGFNPNQEDSLPAGRSAVQEQLQEGFNFIGFALLLALILPSLQPRVPAFYRSTDALDMELHAAAGKHGDFDIRVEDVPDPADMANPQHRLTLVTASATSRPKARILIVANEHARELVTGEVALGLVKSLAEADSPAKGTAVGHGDRLRAAVRNGLELTVLPIANTEGRCLAEGLRPCQRGTADTPLVATDLNRNFPTDWSAGLQLNYLNVALDTHGLSPFSAYQARVIREIAMRHEWDAFLDLHSGNLSLNLPFGHTFGGSKDLQEQLRALEGVRKLCPECIAGPSRDVMKYDNPGQLTDWMYQDRGVVYSYVWEVFSAPGTCAPHFNPSAESELDATVDRWGSMVAALGEFVLERQGMQGTASSPRSVG
ncbi:unnamed protein product [Polarella glacialis]|uniref:Peptidase M14 domain-containing protein n=1 Tax=Polarella glacialis TaxID=89957 RepID=A0A813JTB7_POLGL|nr:unnamed protein product [Polarella glacialis]